MTSESRGFLLRFGVPSLDLLLGTNPNIKGDKTWDEHCGMWVPSGLTTSLAVIGPDGTGKSVLGLHLASTYLRDTTYRAHVLYISTDLVYHRALQVWRSFALNYPSFRDPVFTGCAGLRHRAAAMRPAPPAPEVRLEWYYPGEATRAADGDAQRPSPFYELLHGPPDGHRVAFLDLAQYTAGDDWGFVNRVISTLDQPGPKEHKHLVVIDAIEGFQAFSGDTDAFGEKISRRSRISQIMRLAAEKSHVVFITEEPREGEHSAEEFVTDAVIRLRNRRIRDYSRRTVEVEKVRSQSHVRGEHPYTIRKGNGSTTGDQENDDDPVASHPNPANAASENAQLATDETALGSVVGGSDAKSPDPTGDAGKEAIVPQGYVTVFPSVHCLSREIMKSVLTPDFPAIDPKTLGRAGFGIPYLDDLLVPADVPSAESGLRGLPFGKVTALIGDPHSQKGKLGRCFLAEEFKPYLSTLFQGLKDSNGDIQAVDQQSLALLSRDVGACVYLTTLDQSRDKLIAEICQWFLKEARAGKVEVTDAAVSHLKGFLRERIICRRLEVHDLPNAVLLHVVAHVVEATRRRLQKLNGDGNNPAANRIRLVIEDFSTWKEIYPDIRSETLFLPALLAQLRRANVSTLLIDTHTGRPDAVVNDPFDNELRAMVDYQLYTWRVPYFGENRTAIAAIPPMSSGSPASESGAVVRELRWTPEDERPIVDTLFEMYSGLEEGRPQPVALEIRLFGETPAFKDYFAQENEVLGRIYRGVEDNRPDALRVVLRGEELASRIHDSADTSAEGATPEKVPGARISEGAQTERFRIIKSVSEREYEAFHDVTVLQQETRLDHTLVLGVDEFWRRYAGAFRQQKRYMQEEFDRVDPSGRFGIVQRSGWGLSAGSSEAKSRYKDFDVPGPEPLNLKGGPTGWPEPIDRIPFMWDFGFLLCRGDTWHKHSALPAGNGVTVGDVWTRMAKSPFATSELTRQSGTRATAERPSWREFLGACLAIAKAEAKPDVTAFDLDAGQGESLSCLVLEVWASEICGRLRRIRQPHDPFEAAATTMFPDLVGEYVFDLFKSFLLLVDVLRLEIMVDVRSPFRVGDRPVESGAIACRHWYKTACAWQAKTDLTNSFLLVSCPGNL